MDNKKDHYLLIKNITMKFGGLTALDNVTFNVNEGEIFSIIGPNGAGKTTLFNIISGIYRPTAGKVYLRGRSIEGKQANEICQLGLGRTFQTIRLFENLNVFENVLCARHCRTENNFIKSIFNHGRKERKNSMEYAYELLREFSLAEVWEQKSKNLPYGAQRRLEMVRALATEPEILLLDEPAAGLNPSEVENLVSMIKKIRAKGITIMLVEHRMNLVMNISDRIIVLNYGKKIADGSPEEVKQDSAVIDAYLGSEVNDYAGG